MHDSHVGELDGCSDDIFLFFVFEDDALFADTLAVLLALKAINIFDALYTAYTSI